MGQRDAEPAEGYARIERATSSARPGIRTRNFCLEDRRVAVKHQSRVASLAFQSKPEKGTGADSRYRGHPEFPIRQEDNHVEPKKPRQEQCDKLHDPPFL